MQRLEAIEDRKRFRDRRLAGAARGFKGKVGGGKGGAGKDDGGGGEGQDGGAGGEGKDGGGGRGRVPSLGGAVLAV